MNPIGRPTSARPDALPRLIRLGKGLREAILATMAYVARSTGTEPGQDEIAAVLKSWFTLDEVTNQIGYLRKQQGDRDAPRPKPPSTASPSASTSPPPRPGTRWRAPGFSSGRWPRASS